MTKKFLTPVVLPADPLNPLEAATKQYVDANAGGGGGGTDEVWVGAEPVDAALELWYDPDAPAVVETAPYLHVRREATESIAANGVLVTFDRSVEALDGFASTTGTTYTIPKAGLYLVHGAISFNTGTGVYHLAVMRNAVQDAVLDRVNVNAQGSPTQVNGSAHVRFEAGDTISLYIFGAAMSTYASTTPRLATYLSALWVRS